MKKLIALGAATLLAILFSTLLVNPARTDNPTPTPTPLPKTIPSPTPTTTPMPANTTSAGLASAPTADITPTSGNIGSVLTLTGTNYKAGGNLTIKYDDSVIATTTANNNGAFSAVFKVPAGKSGPHLVTISDGASSQQVTFMVTSPPPQPPPPALPASGDKINKAAFSWSAASGQGPFVYSVQVSRERDFSTLIIDRKNIKNTEYIPAQDEASQFKADTTYYWRIKCADAASNESAWSAARDFTIGGFSLPGWGIYALLGVSAVLIFLLGVWFGRETAIY